MWDTIVFKPMPLLLMGCRVLKTMTPLSKERKGGIVVNAITHNGWGSFVSVLLFCFSVVVLSHCCCLVGRDMMGPWTSNLVPP